MDPVYYLAFEYFLTVIGLFLGYKCFFLKKNNMNYYMRFILTLDLFLLLNIPVRLFELGVADFSKTVLTVFYSLYVIFTTFCMYYWLLFMLKQLGSKLVDSKIKIHISLIPAFISVAFCIVNVWTEWLFYFEEIDGSYIYHRGSIFILQGLIGYLYLIATIILVVYYLLKKQERKIARNCLISMFPVFFCIVLQVLYAGSFLLAGIVFCALIMYVEICLDRQKAYEMNNALSEINQELTHSNEEVAQTMKTLIAISDIHQVIYEIDLQTDKFVEIKAPGYVSLFCKKFVSAKEFLSRFPDAMFIPEDLDAMKEIYNPDLLNERMKNLNSSFGDARGSHNEGWVRTNVVVTERDNEGKISHYVISIQNINEEKLRQKKMEATIYLAEKAQEMKDMFVQTAEALASAIDAKDEYTHGHSIRVAQYSKKIAEIAGFAEEDCEKIYFSGLLHDVGKIGIPDYIINKQGKLTPEEYAEIKMHPVKGREILAHIRKLPYLTMGAKYHHERYDGHGYPEGLKAIDIPSYSRIIAVADAYDAMTSSRSYRKPLPQDKVREEIVKGIGTQFDPEYAKIMLQLIDNDKEYKLKQNEKGNELYCYEYKKSFYGESAISPYKLTVRMHSTQLEPGKENIPAFIIFDAVDSRVHLEEQEKSFYLYTDYCDIRADGKYQSGNIRKIEVDVKDIKQRDDVDLSELDYVVTIFKRKDHVRLFISDGYREVTATIVLPDSSRYAFFGITGQKCYISDIEYEKSNELLPEDSIKRIAEEIRYFDKPDGDIPNIQIDSWRTTATAGIPVKDEMKISFYMRSLPNSRLLWHCPYLILFDSEDGVVGGKNYREFSLISFDGGNGQQDKYTTNQLTVSNTSEFKDWFQWKQGNREGRNLEVTLKRVDNQIFFHTNCGGVVIDNVTIIEGEYKNVYAALSGDEVILECIKVI